MKQLNITNTGYSKFNEYTKGTNLWCNNLSEDFTTDETVHKNNVSLTNIATKLHFISMFYEIFLICN